MRSAMRLPREDVVAGALLLGVLSCWCLVAFEFGLDYSPDSGLYLYAGAQGYLGSLATATQSNYAPGFPWLISAGLLFCDLPGNAATLVHAASLAVIVLGSYQLMRATGANAGFSAVAAMVVGFCPSNAYVFSVYMGEGPLSALLVALVAVVQRALTSSGFCWRLCAVVLASLAPLIKYGAGLVPIASAVALALFADPSQPPRRRRAQLCSDVVLGLSPVAAYFAWNRIREGALSSHPAAHIGLVRNALTAIRTICEGFSGWFGVFLALALVAAFVARKQSSRATRDLPARAALVSAVIALGYFAGIIVGASIVLVDRLHTRLCAPGLTLLLLGLALIMPSSLRSLAQGSSRRARYLTVMCAMVAVAALALPLRDGLVAPMRILITGQRTKVESASEWGFRRSEAALGLQRFYESELLRTPRLSVTLVEAKSDPGRVRRGWVSMAAVLGNTPDRLQGFGSLKLERITETSVLFGWGSVAHSILFLSADMPESRRLPRHVPVQRFVTETVARVLREGHAAGRAEHWILLPKQAAGWFAPEGAVLGGAQILRQRDAGSYRAFLLRT
jgi:Dolichyl-phosphate-mannose-protein mannosyltransferase